MHRQRSLNGRLSFFRVKDKFEDFIRVALCVLVEKRRLFTSMDAGPHFDTILHTLLLALVAWHLVEGLDPLALASAAATKVDDSEDLPYF